MKEKEILERVNQLFMQNGIKSMTMDEISRQLGISKKTLYQYVSNKKELVKKVIELAIEEKQDCISQFYDPKKNAIDILMEITAFVQSTMKELHPSVIFDLKKYHLEAWKIMKDHDEKFIYANIKANIEHGIEEGLYRDNIKPEIITHFYLAMVNTIIDPDILAGSNFSGLEVHTEMMRYHIRGIASNKGREYLKSKFSQGHE